MGCLRGVALVLALTGCGGISFPDGDVFDEDAGGDAGPSIEGGIAQVPDEAGVTPMPSGPEPTPPSVKPEVCNGQDDDGDGKYDEGCPLPLAVDPDVNEYAAQLDSGRVVWVSDDSGEWVLWTRRLPSGEPEELRRSTQTFSLGLDADRIVFGGRNDLDRESDGFTVWDLRDDSEVFVPAGAPHAYTFSTPQLEGDYLVYSESLPINCGGWCDEAEVYLHDLRTGITQAIASHTGTIQSAPRINGGQIVWWDDRYGHHIDPIGIEHWGDVMAAAVPYEGGFRRLTMAQPNSMSIIAFEAGRVLMNKEIAPTVDQYQLMVVETQELIPLDWALRQGDSVLDMSEEHLLVKRDPLGRCHLELIHLESRSAIALDTQDYCPDSAQVDGDFVVWPKVVGDSADLYWMDIGDLR